MNAEFLAVLDHLTREKGIDREIIIEAVEAAVASAARKALGPVKGANVEVKVDRTTGAIRIYADEKELPEANFGRIAAQTAKQVIFHKIREAERGVIFNEFSPKANSLMTGTMHRFERGAIVVDLGKTDAIIPKREQSPKESFRPGDRIRAYCLEVNKTSKGPQIILSRAHPSLVRELFKLEIPEIGQGIVEIKGISREAGDRSKVAVYSKDEKIDCVGACVGMRGTRVKDIVRELHGEKLDIIRWSPKLEEFIAAALSPAKVAEIHLSPDGKRAEVIVEDDQLSLAIGKKGQNVRLASRLAGLDMDVRSRAQMVAMAKYSVRDLPGVGPKLLEVLEEAGYETVFAIARLTVEDLTQLKGVGEKIASKLIESAKELMSQINAQAAAEAAAQEEQVAAAAQTPAPEAEVPAVETPESLPEQESTEEKKEPDAESEEK